MEKDGGERNGVKTTDTVVRVIEALMTLNGGRVTEVAEYLDMAPSTIHRHLTSLEEHDFVAKEGDTYKIGLRFLTVGGYARNQKSEYTIVKPFVKEIAEEIDCRSVFMVEEHGLAVYLFRGAGSHAVETHTVVGSRRHMHLIAGGKAILAHYPRERVDEIIDRWGLPQQTENSITDRETLYEQLEEIKERGVAFNRGESISGLHAVAAPVFGKRDEVLGALTVSGPQSRFTQENLEHDIPDRLIGTVKELQLKIQFSNVPSITTTELDVSTTTSGEDELQEY